jgi:putative nucleotidyltransferase with HDIG domain
MSSTDQAPTKPKRSIFIAEDDSTFRRLLSKTLSTQGFNIREAETGLVAKTIFDLAPESYDVIISDIRMPGMDGAELLRHVRSKSQIPFIVMTGFSEIMDTVEAFKLGANDFIPKPFRIDVLLTAINGCFERKVVAGQDAAPAEMPVYCPIHVDEFISTSRLLSDIYIKLSSQHFIRVAYKGESTPLERLRTYKDKQVEFLYVTVKDFSDYVGFNLRLAGTVVANASIDQEKKRHLLMHTTEILVEQCYLDKLSKEAVKPAQALIESTISLLAEDSDIMNLLADLSKRPDRLYAHSVAVALFSAMTARQNGWFAISTLFKVIVSALLHDIGKREIDPEIIKKRRLTRTFEETRILESHPARGRDIVSQLKSLPEDISQIVHQHHETHAGNGYPLRIQGGDIHPLAKLIGTVDAFVEHTLPVSPDARAKSPHEALKWLATDGGDMVDILFVRKLQEILGTEKEPLQKVS